MSKKEEKKVLIEEFDIAIREMEEFISEPISKYSNDGNVSDLITEYEVKLSFLNKQKMNIKKFMKKNGGSITGNDSKFFFCLTTPEKQFDIELIEKLFNSGKLGKVLERDAIIEKSTKKSNVKKILIKIEEEYDSDTRNEISELINNCMKETGYYNVTINRHEKS